MKCTSFNTQTIQLICMLFSIAVVVYLFLRQYAKGPVATDSKSKEQKLHTFYISGILVFIIIELVTGMCMGNDRHTDILSYVSFAATLSSLIMSVVAIIFTIVYNNRGSEQLDKMDSASQGINNSLNDFKDTSVKLSQSIDNLSEMSDSISSAVEDFRTESEQLGDRLEKISEKLDRIELKTDKTYEATTMNAAPKDDKKKPISTEGLKEYLSHCSVAGLLALLACALSKEKDKEFTLDEVAINSDSAYYMYGYIMATQASGFISVKSNEKEKKFSVKRVDDNMKDLIYKQLDKRLKEASESGKENYKKLIERVEKAFE